MRTDSVALAQPEAVKLNTPSGKLAPTGAPAGALVPIWAPEIVQPGGAPTCTPALPPLGNATPGWVHTWGVADAEAEAPLVPAVLLAVTVNVCATPLVRPEMVQVSAPVVVQLPAGEPVTV